MVTVLPGIILILAKQLGAPTQQTLETPSPRSWIGSGHVTGTAIVAEQTGHGIKQIKVGKGFSVDAWIPAWGAFSAIFRGEELHKVFTNGSTKLVARLPGISTGWFSVSRDGLNVASVNSRSMILSIFRLSTTNGPRVVKMINLSKANSRIDTSVEAGESGVAWSPDGQLIAISIPIGNDIDNNGIGRPNTAIVNVGSGHVQLVSGASPLCFVDNQSFLGIPWGVGTGSGNTIDLCNLNGKRKHVINNAFSVMFDGREVIALKEGGYELAKLIGYDPKTWRATGRIQYVRIPPPYFERIASSDAEITSRHSR